MSRISFELLLRCLPTTHWKFVPLISMMCLLGAIAPPVLAESDTISFDSPVAEHLPVPDPAASIAPPSPQADLQPSSPNDKNPSRPTLGELVNQTLEATAPLPAQPGSVSQPTPAPAIAQLPPLATPATQLPVPYPPSHAIGQSPPPPPNPGNIPVGWPNTMVPGAYPQVTPPGAYPYNVVPVPVYIYVYGGMPAQATGTPTGAAPHLPMAPYGVAPPPTPPTTFPIGAPPTVPLVPYGMTPPPTQWASPYGVPTPPSGAPLPPLPAPAYGTVYPGLYPPGVGTAPMAYPYGVVPGMGSPMPTIAAPYPPMLPPGAALPPSAYPYAQTTAPTVTPAPTAETAPTQPGLAPLPAIPTPGTTPTSSQPLIRTTALNQPELRFQGVYIYQGDEGSGRARVTGTLPLSPNILFGGTIDFVDGRAFTDSENEGINLNELYLAATVPSVPTLRFAIGQLDLTSYFDRNSFAKDGASMFFNPVFQTNPALAATGIGSRQAALVNWSITDYAEAKAAVFSSSRDISDFSIDGFAGELGLRFGNFIVRGTYATNRDGGQRDGFREIFQIDRGNGRYGLSDGDREEAFGVNAEIFFPEIKMGLFGRYGQYNNRAINRSANTYNVGITFLDLFMKHDRLGVAYGRELSNESLRRRAGDRNPDVFEVFYDFAVLPNLRLGFSFQAADNFSETILGVRLKTDFNMISPSRSTNSIRN